MTTWRPSGEDYGAALEGQNPWQSLGSVPVEYAKPVLRDLAEVLYQRLQVAPNRYQLILGPRRVGKTTVMYQTVQRLLDSRVPASRLWWFRLDHPLLLEFTLGGWVEMLIENFKPSNEQPLYLFLDEITYADNWDLWLKTFYDQNYPVRIVATSSATAAIKQRRLESGVGRWEEQYLSPWLFHEYLSLQPEPPTLISEIPVGESLSDTITAVISAGVTGDLEKSRRRFLTVGGFPELLTAQVEDENSDILRSQRVLRSDAVERAVYRDIPQAFGIAEPMKLERLLCTLGGQMAGMLSPSKLSNSQQISQPTVDKYISYLESAFIVFTLPNYSGNEESVQRRGRKLYFVDGAVRNAALQRGLAPLRDPAEFGYLIENGAASHLHALSQQTNARLYHWRKGKTEVDLVYADLHNPLAFELTASTRHSRHGLAEFQSQFPEFAGHCYVVAPDVAPAFPGADGIGRIPYDLFLCLVGVQAAAALRRNLGGQLVFDQLFL